jgi:hypothetical protein
MTSRLRSGEPMPPWTKSYVMPVGLAPDMWDCFDSGFSARR